jgi:hypothetical protein
VQGCILRQLLYFAEVVVISASVSLRLIILRGTRTATVLPGCPLDPRVASLVLLRATAVLLLQLLPRCHMCWAHSIGSDLCGLTGGRGADWESLTQLRARDEVCACGTASGSTSNDLRGSIVRESCLG